MQKYTWQSYHVKYQWFFPSSINSILHQWWYITLQNRTYRTIWDQAEMHPHLCRQSRSEFPRGRQSRRVLGTRAVKGLSWSQLVITPKPSQLTHLDYIPHIPQLKYGKLLKEDQDHCKGTAPFIHSFRWFMLVLTLKAGNHCKCSICLWTKCCAHISRSVSVPPFSWAGSAPTCRIEVMWPRLCWATVCSGKMNCNPEHKKK